MLGKEIIEFITERNIGDKDVIVNFSYKGNAAYVLDIQNINWDADERNVILDIGKIDNIL